MRPLSHEPQGPNMKAGIQYSYLACLRTMIVAQRPMQYQIQTVHATGRNTLLASGVAWPI